ncbi:DUF1353 domain-containing protein [Photobacterium sp. J15]|uniref:DUF1353 domain-containing protein n=1 Tax=Photobacterium sp. J15 TaxID=265901 RepID=UPI0007E41FDB|nr:DUF1353 domain-containing protein [Photobacterium sp. J15]
MLKQPSLTPHANENKYELVRDYEILVEGVEIVVPKFFRYDGASIPALAWQATYSPFHPDVMLPSMIHDWLYYNHQVEQEQSDDIFYRLLRDNGVNYLKASMMWGAVRTAGGLFWDNDKEDEAMLIALCNKVKSRPNFNRYKLPDAIVTQCS